MSISDVEPVLASPMLFNSLCQTLEKDITIAVCKKLKKAVADPICTSLKQSLVDSLHAEAAHDDPFRAHRAAQFRATLAGIISNAACAALKQAMDDTACSTLKSTIHHSFELTLRRERIEDVRIVPSVTPSLVDSFCTSLVQIAGNAVCAALKQAMDDTVCAALEKGVHRSLAQLPIQRREDVITDIMEVWLDSKFVWHAALDIDDASNTFSGVEEDIVKEVCSRLKAAATSTLCRLLQQTIKDTVEQHATECKAKCQREVQEFKAYERPRIPVRSIALVFTAGFIVISLLAATVVPGSPWRQDLSQVFQPSATMTAPSGQPDGGSSGGKSGSDGSGGGEQGKIPTQFGASFSPSTPVSGKSFTISAVLQANGRGVANASVALQVPEIQISYKSLNFATFQGSSKTNWKTVNNTTTDSEGKCAFTRTVKEGDFTYRVHFSGSDAYQAADHEINITVKALQPIATALTLYVGDQDSPIISGRLTQADNPEIGISGQIVELNVTWLNVSSGAVQHTWPSGMTSQDGSYNIVIGTFNANPPSNYWAVTQIQATFLNRGQGNYLPSSSQIWED